MIDPIPRRWHLYTVDMNPRVGTKPGKIRPCLILQPEAFGKGGLDSTVVIPLTTKILPLAADPLRIRLQKGICGLKQESDFMIDQIIAWDNNLFREDLGEIPEFIKIKVKKAIKEFLDLD